ncbi:MAG: FAD-linked oxidase C-terminal domain-containing protein, partial [Pseudomonadota bacterium]
PARPEARARAAEARAELIELFRRRGAGRLQIGRRYAYAEDLEPATLSALRALKRALDPDGVLNPGVLGL